jgi:predicted nuclease with TOPRIM domain
MWIPINKEKGAKFERKINFVMKIEVSNGEIIDKLTIIQIKLERIKDAAKLKNLKKEYAELKTVSSSIISTSDPLYVSLYEVNCELWDIEDHIRDLERNKDFGDDFLATARAVYFKNDKRSELKREINLKTFSGLIEEKSYEKY